MSWTLVNSVSAKPGSTGGASTAIDTTGANLIVLSVSSYAGGTGLTVSDSKGNTWTPLTQKSGVNARCRLYYCASPVVGTGHTFSVTGTGIYPAFDALAFSGAAASPFDVENGATASGVTSVQPGSVMPSANGELIVTGMCSDGTFASGPSVDSGFTLDAWLGYTASVNMGGGGAYLVQTTAAAVNPTWSWSTARGAVAVVAAFKAAAGGGGTPFPFFFDESLSGGMTPLGMGW